MKDDGVDKDEDDERDDEPKNSSDENRVGFFLLKLIDPRNE